MAKVRIQARAADIEDAEEEHLPPPVHNKPHHKTGHHVGALTVLARVWRRKGFVGWYQVSPLSCLGLRIVRESYLGLFTGDGCPISQGSLDASAPVHVQGPVRALHVGSHGAPLSRPGRKAVDKLKYHIDVTCRVLRLLFCRFAAYITCEFESHYSWPYSGLAALSTRFCMRSCVAVASANH